MKKIALLIFTSLCCLVMVAQLYTGKTGISPQEKLNNEYCNGLFKTSDGTIIDLLNDNETAKSYLNVLEWLQGRIAGLQIYHTRYGTPVPFIRNTRASLFVDEIPVDPAFLNDLPVADIAMIKIIKGPFAGAAGNGGGGTIAIYTIKGDDEEEGEDHDTAK
jgi:TonB-dependent Receptor Plug Domain